MLWKDKSLNKQHLVSIKTGVLSPWIAADSQQCKCPDKHIIHNCQNDNRKKSVTVYANKENQSISLL